MREPSSDTTSAVRQAIARLAYQRGEVRLVKPDLAGCQWLVTSPRGLFAIGPSDAEPVAYGWFFGICRQGDHLYVFENCGHRDRDAALGRIIRFRVRGGMLERPKVIVQGLHGNVHQLAIIGGMLCAVDTANQAIRRFTMDGTPIDVQRPFPPAPATDTSGAYLHINSIAEIDGRIGLMLHNGAAVPEKNSELAWLYPDWTVAQRIGIAGRYCHDIVADRQGKIWYSASQSGEIVRNDGRRVQVTAELMTRGIAIGQDDMTAVGMCTFGPRHMRGALNGGIAILDAEHRRVRTIDLPGPPADIIAWRDSDGG